MAIAACLLCISWLRWDQLAAGTAVLLRGEAALDSYLVADGPNQELGLGPVLTARSKLGQTGMSGAAARFMGRRHFLRSRAPSFALD